MAKNIVVTISPMLSDGMFKIEGCTIVYNPKTGQYDEIKADRCITIDTVASVKVNITEFAINEVFERIKEKKLEVLRGCQ